MNHNHKKVLLIAMPFAGSTIPSIQLAVLKDYLKERNIDITTKHLYLKAAEYYGIVNYNCLINRPSDSYTAQMAYSRYLFPDHWEKNENIFREYFNRILSESNEMRQNFSFETYVGKTDQFLNWAMNDIEWNNYDLIGFTLNYGQLLPSLAVSKNIKESFPDKKIVFGGSRTTDILGKRILNSFRYVDYTVSGDGEEALFSLASNIENLNEIPNLTFRENDEIIENRTDSTINLNESSTLDFDSFFENLSSTSVDVQQYFYYYGRLPVEISRGCWWNKCTFCNHNVQHKTYREKDCKKVLEEIEFLSNKYKILDFHLNGNNILRKEFHSLIDGLKELEKDYSFIAEIRADQLKSDDYTGLKEAGFTTIQTGIESFSQNYLKKMDKGTRVIDNIAALKFCKENGIFNSYNIIVNYPNEEKLDFEETKKNIEHIKYYLDPPNVNNLLIGYGSPIFNNPEKFNIESYCNTSIDKLIFPKEYLENNFSFFYDFNRKNQIPNNNWKALIDEWKSIRNRIIYDGAKKQTALDQMIFYYLDGKEFLKIVDKRFMDNIRIFNLDETEREIFLSCIDIISYHDLCEKLSNIPDYELISILRSFEKMGLVFVEDDYYLSLPLNYKKCIGINYKKETIDKFEQKELIH